MAIKVIKVKGDGLVMEVEASGVITPGEIVEFTSAATDTVVRHNSAGQNVVPLIVALEDGEQGKEIGDNYASADKLKVWFPTRGSIFFGLISNGQSVTKGGLVESDGVGRLDAHTPDTESIGADSSGNITTIYTQQIVGMTLDTVDMSTSSAADPSGRARIVAV